MPNKSNIFYLLIIMCLFKFSFSEKKIIVIEGDNLDLAIKNSTENKFKLFLVFHVKNCPYCTHALKVLKNQVLKNFDEEEEIFFGSVDLDNQLNVWVGLRFNITRIPYIILIENNKIYHYENQFEESLVMKFINEEKNIEDGENIPQPVTFRQKFYVAVDELTERLQGVVDMIGLKIKWNMKMTYVFLIVIFVAFVYIESKIIQGCMNLFNFGKKRVKGNEIKNMDKNEGKEKKEEKNDKKEKEEKKIKKE